MACLDEDIVCAWIERRLPAAERAPVDAHIDSCADCRRLIATVVQRSSDGLVSRSAGDGTDATLPRSAGAVAIASGERIGRYCVTGILGAGGMGVVYSAFDPHLQRTVALKIVRPEFAQLDVELRARLVREAQAMAQVRHPHVITVFDVGTFDGRLFVAMEIVHGSTLTAWQSARTRSVDEILHVFRAAGRGLEAAHAAGFVHRDFKPDNILIGRDGRVCVTDFGLARPLSVRLQPDGDALDGMPTVDEGLTQAGTVVGTPAYMAPEQMRGAISDPRADQFSFCVALFEALYGVRPFPGKSMAELEYAILSGNRLRPTRRGVPRRVRRALARGLQADRGARFGAMDELLSALEPPRATRRPIIALAAACVSSIIAVGVARVVANRGDRAALCRAAGGRIGSVWNDERRAELSRVLGSSDAASRARATLVITSLDRYAQAWTAAHRDACDATHVRGEQSEALLDVRMQCLDQRRRELDELANVLASDPTLGDRAAQSLQALTSVDVCADAATQRRAETSDGPTPSLEQPRRMLARATAEFGAHKCKDALEHATSAADGARAAAATSLAAEATLQRARAQRCLGELVASRALLTDAAVLAARARDDVTLTRVAAQAVDVDAQAADFADADHWATMAADAVKRSSDDPRAQGEYLYSAALLEWRQHHFDAAIQKHLQAQRALERMPGNEFERLRNIGQLAAVLGDMGRFAEAAPLHERVRDGFARMLGPDNYATLTVDENIALERWEQGDLAAAIPGERHLLEHLSGGDASHFSTAAGNYSWMLLEAGRTADALAWAHRALAAAERIDGGHDEETEYALGALGASLVASGRAHEAIPNLEQALVLQHGDEMAGDRADTSFALAQALWNERRDRARAVALAQDATRYWTSHPLGERRRGQLAQAQAWLSQHTVTR
jgi:eukaryotic-like serine/threonine-protein kinase